MHECVSSKWIDEAGMIAALFDHKIQVAEGGLFGRNEREGKKEMAS